MGIFSKDKPPELYRIKSLKGSIDYYLRDKEKHQKEIDAADERIKYYQIEIDALTSELNRIKELQNASIEKA